MIGGLRARATLDRYSTVVIAVCVVAALVGGLVAYDAHATESTVTESRTVEEGSLSVDWDHAARVRNVENSTVYSAGERVENRSTYLKRVMPVLDGATTFDYETTTDEPLRVQVDRRVVIRNVALTDGRDGERTVYWQRTRELGSTTTTLQPGDGRRTTFQLNVTETYREAANESARLGSPGRNEVVVVAEVTASRAGAPNRTRRFVFTVVDDAQTYRVQGESGAVRFNRTETTSVPVRPDPVRGYGGPALAVLGLLGAGFIVEARRRGALALSETERARLTYDDHRSEYEEWITSGRLPAAVFDRPRIEVDSLAGLADVAIDAGERVVHDTDRGEYAVVHDDLVYAFEPPTKEDDALAASNVSTDDVLAEAGADTDDLPFGDADAQDPDSVLDDDAGDAREVLDHEELGADAGSED